MINNTVFANKVYEAAKKIPYGQVATYLDIAKAIGNPKATRAVGNALHHNPEMIVIPCHRVVNSKGQLALHFGYRGQEGQKELLEKEGVIVVNFRVDLKQYRVKENILWTPSHS